MSVYLDRLKTQARTAPPSKLVLRGSRQLHAAGRWKERGESSRPRVPRQPNSAAVVLLDADCGRRRNPTCFYLHSTFTTITRPTAIARESCTSRSPACDISTHTSFTRDAGSVNNLSLFYGEEVLLAWKHHSPNWGKHRSSIMFSRRLASRFTTSSASSISYLRPFSSTQRPQRSPALSDIEPGRATDFDNKQRQFREELTANVRRQKEQERVSQSASNQSTTATAESPLSSTSSSIDNLTSIHKGKGLGSLVHRHRRSRAPARRSEQQQAQTRLRPTE